MANARGMENRQFNGKLHHDGAHVEVTFICGIDEAGRVNIVFHQFQCDDKSAFLLKNHDEPGARFTKFRLTGDAVDGTTFDCDNIVMVNLGSCFSEDCQTFAPVVAYSLIKFVIRSAESGLPVLVCRIKGFESFRGLSTSSPLGVVEMVGEMDANGKNEISGWVRIRANQSYENIEEWRKKAEALCLHIRHLMSFGAGISLSCPIVEFHKNRMVYIDVYSRSEQEKSIFPVFSPLHLQQFFESVVHSHFDPSILVKKLTYATQWFTMRNAYREANLISSMTVLENLVGSNLPEEDTLILSSKVFDKFRKKLRCGIKEQAENLFDDQIIQKSLVTDLNERLADLNRRPLLYKIKLLATRWGVDLSDIPEQRITEAKSARDHVVHRGHYESKLTTAEDLHDHILTVREIVVRFVLTALDFHGSYISYLYGSSLKQIKRDAPIPNSNESKADA